MKPVVAVVGRERDLVEGCDDGGGGRSLRHRPVIRGMPGRILGRMASPARIRRDEAGLRALMRKRRRIAFREGAVLCSAARAPHDQPDESPDGDDEHPSPSARVPRRRKCDRDAGDREQDEEQLEHATRPGRG
jgi:hypothetical protein